MSELTRTHLLSLQGLSVFMSFDEESRNGDILILAILVRGSRPMYSSLCLSGCTPLTTVQTDDSDSCHWLQSRLFRQLTKKMTVRESQSMLHVISVAHAVYVTCYFRYMFSLGPSSASIGSVRIYRSAIRTL